MGMVDLKFSYNLFLGRSPDESGQEAYEDATPKYLASIIVDSIEFRDQIIGSLRGGRWPLKPIFTVPPSKSLLDWVENCLSDKVIKNECSLSLNGWKNLYIAIFSDQRFLENTGTLDIGREIITLLNAASFDFSDAERERAVALTSGLWDPEWYIHNNPDVATTNTDPLLHYSLFGRMELRSPGPNFNARNYFNSYMWSEKSNISPLHHYIAFGRDLGYVSTWTSQAEEWLYKYNNVSELEWSIISRKIGQQETFIIARENELYKIYEISSNKLISDSHTITSISDFIKKNCGNHLIILGLECSISMQAAKLFALHHVMTQKSVCISDFSYQNEPDGSQNIFVLPSFSPRYLQQIPNAIGCVSILSKDQHFYDLMSEISEDNSISEFEPFFSNILSIKQRVDVGHISRALYLRSGSVNMPTSQLKATKSSPTTPTVLIVIPTRDQYELLIACIDSIVRLTRYKLEYITICVVDNNSTDIKTLEYISSLENKKSATGPKFIVMRDSRTFNYSRLNNQAVSSNTSEIVVLLNNDTVIIDQDWLLKITHHLSDDEVGIVGAKLVYPDLTVQHGGVVLGYKGVAGHAGHGLNSNDPGPYFTNSLTREVGAVTGACLATRTSTYKRLGGLDPTFQVAFNDVALCAAALRVGFVNLLINDPLIIHYESKSRGYDDNPEKIARWKTESSAFLKHIWTSDQTDPFYNTSLSLESMFALASPPRAPALPLQAYADIDFPPIMMASITYKMGHGVAVVIEQQAKYLREQGFTVYLAGPRGENETPATSIDRIFADTAEAIADLACKLGVGFVICHTPPYFSVKRWIGSYPLVIQYDYGEPPAQWFDDADQRKAVNHEKYFSFKLSKFNACISEAVRNESEILNAQVLPLANSHLGLWSDELYAKRDMVRKKFEWGDRPVFLNVCRFHLAEQNYKGIDAYIDAMLSYRFAYGDDAIFVLAGKGTDAEAEELECRGLIVFRNVSDQELLDLYAAADVYTNFSLWEGYNLGIAQALAMGLPVVASDIPAHRSFGVITPQSVSERNIALEAARLSTKEYIRCANIIPWSDSLKIFLDFLKDSWKLEVGGEIGIKRPDFSSFGLVFDSKSTVSLLSQNTKLPI